MRNTLLSIVVVAVLAHCASLFADEIAVALPAGVTAEWDIAKAERQATPTRERICINGLWRWQPARGDADEPPAKNWGYFKVPGCWPGITDYMQKDCQTVFAHPSWKNEKLASTTVAWYEREIAIPSNWAGRRIALAAEYVNSYAAVFVDGKKAGEIRFPGGEADLTAACRPGKKHLLSLLVVAMPLKEALLSYQDTNSPASSGRPCRAAACAAMCFSKARPPERGSPMSKSTRRSATAKSRSMPRSPIFPPTETFSCVLA